MVETEEGCFQSNAPYIKLFMTSMADNGKRCKKKKKTSFRAKTSCGIRVCRSGRKRARTKSRRTPTLGTDTAFRFKGRYLLRRSRLLSQSNRTFVVLFQCVGGRRRFFKTSSLFAESDTQKNFFFGILPKARGGDFV